MKLLKRAAAKSFQLLCKPAWKEFERSIHSPTLAQERTLRAILQEAAKTEYGKALHLTGKESYQEFSKLVEPQKYDQHLKPWIEKQSQNPANSIFSPGGMRVLEKSSGSSGTAKLIPYNHAILKSFEKYFRIWAYDILKNGPRFRSYRTYISISPSLGKDREAGLSDDSEYLSLPLRFLLKPFLAVPLDLKQVRDPEEFRHLLCAYLANAEDLEIISIWHPSLFLVTMEYLQTHRQEIAHTLKTNPRFRANPEVLRKLSSNFQMAELWPHLKFISAWDGANSAIYAEKLKKLFPKATFQAKGLLSTEAPITLPTIEKSTLPFLCDVFLEFVHEEFGIKRIHELRVGEKYQVLVTQAGGFLRYDLGDEILVTNSGLSNCPAIQFIGRSGQISDLVGEKLTEENFQSLQAWLAAEFGLSSLCVLPINSNPPYYQFFYEANQAIPLASFEQFLMTHHHYSYARDMGQLIPAKAERIKNLSDLLLQFYSRKRAMRQGDIKLKLLVKNPLEAAEILQYKVESGAQYEIS